jgi:ABC-type transporter Mla subunit MlaD
MPHMAPAAIVAAIVQVIQAVAPLIQQFLESNQSNSDDFKQGKKDLKEYLDTLNANLQKLDQQIEKATGKSFPITTNPVNSAEEARALAADLEALAAEAEKDITSPLHGNVDQLRSQASALRIAAIKLDGEGQSMDPEGTFSRTLHPANGSYVAKPEFSFDGTGAPISPSAPPSGTFGTTSATSN